jgi:hypothetical protein
MTALTDTADRAGIIAPVPQAPVTNRRRSIPRMLADPRVRLAAGTAALLVTAMNVHRDRVGPREAATFRAVNGLPGRLYSPAWVVMQLGTLGAAPAAAGAATLAGDRELAGRLLAGGTTAWALSKVIKRMVQRPRPAMLLPATHVRGSEAARARVPVRACRRGRRAGRRRLHPARPGRPCPHPGCRSRRGTDPDLCRRPPAARRRRRRSAGTGHRRSNSPGHQSHHPASSPREAASTLESAESYRRISSSASVVNLE